MKYKDIRDALTHGERALAYNVWEVYVDKRKGGGDMHETPLPKLVEALDFAARAVKGKRRHLYQKLEERLRELQR